MPDLSAFPITKRWPPKHPDRLQLYSLPTPNGVKVSIMLEEIELPNKDARPRRIVITSDDSIWYGDFARGYLGRYKPDSGEFAEWPLPGGANSLPYGMAVDKFDRVWVVETGRSPNEFVGFDTRAEEFFSVTEIPSGAGAVRNMDYFEPAGEIWFGTDMNTIGRAKVH